MEWPDNHHLDAAIGWLTLGNTAEAWTEFEKLTPTHRTLPEALAFEWQLLSTEKRWPDAAAVGEHWVEAAPDEPAAWIQRSFALHEGRQTQQAWEKLLPAVKRFPQVNTIPYNLACYACQLGDLDTARRWLRRSLLCVKDTAERMLWTTAAQQDRDLEPLWDEIREGKLS